NTLTSESLVAVPLFLLMGEFLFRSAAVDELYGALDTLIGRSRIRLYAVSVVLATILGTMSGSAMADAAILSRTLYPGMVARGYDRRLSAGLILAGATLAPIIPPSILAVILATLAQVSIAELLVAGFVPGVLLACALLLYAWLRVVIDPSKAPPIDPPDPGRTAGRRLRALAKLAPFCVVIFMVVGLILLGIATPTESAAAGVVATMLVALYLGTLRLRMIGEALYSAARTSATILVIIMSANLFGQLLAFTGAPEASVRLVEHLDLGPWLVFIVLMAICVVACMFIGQTEFMVISVPILSPIIQSVGFDPIWFWMLYLINITAGGMTPPFGMTMFVFKASVPEMSLVDIYNSTWPVIGVIALAIALMALFPGIVLVAPHLLR
ncbi:MAG: TRAP transporter large permease, partial [Candidatus Eiseniibacteriota bacterium]